MSNHSIAAFPGTRGQTCVDFITTHHPDWRVSFNPPKFDYEANVQVLESPTATAVWQCFPLGEDRPLYQDLAAHLHTPWLHLLFQEHIVWEYHLYDAQKKLIDQFQPLPQIWGLDTPLIGSAQTLAPLWNINPARIQKYLKPWSKPLYRKKAYFCRDQFRYGHSEQGYDFLTALTGIHFPE